MNRRFGLVLEKIKSFVYTKNEKKSSFRSKFDSVFCSSKAFDMRMSDIQLEDNNFIEDAIKKNFTRTHR